MKTRLLLLSFFCTLFFVYSCKQELEITTSLYSEEDHELLNQYLDLPNQTTDYTLHFPKYSRVSPITTDNEVATLGRVIFYDKNLSKDRSISCASCHKQTLAFSDGVALSKGVEGKTTQRNSLALGAVFSFAKYYGPISLNRIPFMWDNRFESVADQSRAAFRDENEMGMHMEEVVNQINKQPYYSPLLTKAFGITSASEAEVLEALNVFINSIGSFNSKFDKELDKAYSENDNNFVSTYQSMNGFTEKENRGKSLFLSNCSSCHGSIVGPAGSVAEYNGLELVADDVGYQKVSENPMDKGRFKVPTLRNITLTAPYMHDGRFATLDEVLEHYSTGIRYAENLGDQLKEDDQARKFNFTPEDKEAFLAFFNTLLDQQFVTDPKFSDPFKQ